jgi:hypothetical protein
MRGKNEKGQIEDPLFSKVAGSWRGFIVDRKTARSKRLIAA